MPSLTELLEQQSVLIVEATIPAGMTIAEWRRDGGYDSGPRRHPMMWIGSIQEAPRFAEQRSRWLVGEFVESYVRWREAAGAANNAYARWTGADRPRRGIAFAAYRAALDGEESAARAHRECAERIARS